MKRFILLPLFILVFFTGNAQIDQWSRAYNWRSYSTALTLTNPASALSKYGVGIEYRRGNFGYITTYSKYIGYYQGKNYDAGMRFYMRRKWEHRKHKWGYEDFVYTKLTFGDALLVPNKYSFIGVSDPLENLYYEYIGAGGGYGRRYHRGIFFVTVKAGMKATYAGLAEEDKIYFRLFYLAGPGSVVEASANFGIQL